MIWLSVCLVLLLPLTVVADDWPQWRGPTGDNHAAAGATAPNAWNDTSGLAWKTPVPGRGHSSPVVVGNRIYLTTCEEARQTQSLLIFDRNTGELLRKSPAHQGDLPPTIHVNNTHASPTVACDGRQVYALFYNDYAVWITAFDLEGSRLWQTRVTDFDPQKYEYGFASSPMLVGDSLVVSAEYDGPHSGLYALDTATGELRWKTPRPESSSFSTPIAVGLDKNGPLVMSGHRRIAAYDPASGRERWAVKASAAATCGTMVWDAGLGLLFASGGFPEKITCAVRADGDHEIVWETDVRCYEQSLLVVNGYVYAVSDSGIAHCIRGRDGREMWKQRLGGRYAASPVHVDGKVYVTNERGTTFVFAASPDGLELLGENQLGDECYATSSPLEGRLYHRYADRSSGKRQEFLAAIGE